MPVQIKGVGSIDGLDQGLDVGIVTATSFVGTGVSIVGVVTATSFSGSGVNLTSLPSQITFNNATADRVLTSNGGTAVNAEANLTFNGNNLQFNTTANGHAVILKSTGNYYNKLSFDSGNTSAGGSLAFIDFSWDGDKVADIYAVAGSDTTNKDDGHLVFRTSPSQGNIGERLRITSDGKIGIAHHVAGQIAKELTIRPANDGGIRFVRPGETSASPNIHLDLTTTTSGSAFPSGEAYTVKYKTMNCDQIFETYAGGGTGGNISFRTSTSNNSSESLRIKSGGDVSIPDGNLILASGHGIDFSATGGVTSGGQSEILSDYEQGTFTATLSSSGGGASFASGHIQTACLYVKIGSMVHVQGYFSGTNVTGGGTGIVKVSGLPFASNNTTYYTICLTHNTMTAQACTGAYIQYANTYFFPIQSGATSGSAFNVGNPRYMMFGGSYPVQF